MASAAGKSTKDTVNALLGSVPPPPPRTPRQEPEPASSPRRTRAEQREPVPVTPSGHKEPITQTRIPTSLFERARAAKDAAGDTHEVWFLDAFDAVFDDLAEHYRPRAARRSRVPARQRRTRRPTGEPLTSYPLRLTAEEVAVLEERKAELNPPSMADFVSTIVRLRLEQLEGAAQDGMTQR